MKKIIGGLLEYARVPRPSEPTTQAASGTAAPGQSEPSAVVRHVAALVAPQLKKARAQLVTEVPAGKPISIEAHALQQVLVNLIQNAAQALSGDATGGGTITVTAKPVAGGIATQLSIADDGPGIPPGDRARVFDPFFTTKAPGTGTGLGLAVCKHLVATAGGSIEVGEGPNGRGAEFRVVIPNAT
jgi:signal transduction histidine kinase